MTTHKLNLSEIPTHSLTSILQIPASRLTLPDVDEIWSSWYVEDADTFEDFQSYNPPTPTTTSAVAGTAGVAGTGGATTTAVGATFRSMSARQVSGQFEEDAVAKSWEDDWEDEDLEDTYDAIMGKISHYAAMKAAGNA